MPRRCAFGRCVGRPIYGFPCIWNNKATEKNVTSNGKPRKNTSSYDDIEMMCKGDERGAESWNECTNENPTLEYPIDELFQEQMGDTSAVFQSAQLSSDIPYFDMQDAFMDKMLPSPTPTLVSSMSSSTISSVGTNTSCESPGPTLRIPSDVPTTRKRNRKGVNSVRAIFCKIHKKPGMIDVVSRRCEWKWGCTKRPLYGFPGGRPKVCASHKTESMVDRKSRHCAASHCVTVPSYSFPGEKAQFCQKHATLGMVNVVSSQCIFHGCKTRASYAMCRGNKAILCAVHKESRMVDVRSRQCKEEGCVHQPSFGEIGSRPAYCSLHKRYGMVDVKNRGVKRSDRDDRDVQRNESRPRRRARGRKYQQAVTQDNLETHMWSEAHHNQDYMFVNTLPIVEKLELADQYPANSSVVPELTYPSVIPDMERSYGLFQGTIHCGFDQGDTGSNGNVQQNGCHELVERSSSPTNLQGGAQWQNQIFPPDLPLITNLIPSEDTIIPEYNWDSKGSDTQSNSLESYETVGSPPLLDPMSLTTSVSWETVVQSPGSTLASPCTELQYFDKDCLNYNRACACIHCNSLASKPGLPECWDTVQDSRSFCSR